MADALLDNRWGSDDAGFSNAIGSGLDIDGVQVGNNRSSQNPVLAAKTRTDPQVIGKKSKVGKTGKTVQPNLFYNQSVDLQVFSEIGDTKSRMMRKGTYLPSIGADSNLIERKRQFEEDPNLYADYYSPETETRLDQIGKPGNLQVRQQRAIHASKLPLIGRPRNLFASENHRKGREKENEAGPSGPNAKPIIEIEGAAYNKNLSASNSPVAFKSTPALLHTKPAAKVQKNYGKVSEFKLLVAPAGVKKTKKTKKEGGNDSRVSYGNIDNSFNEISPFKDEAPLLVKSQTFENRLGGDPQKTESFDDTCMNPLVGVRASIKKNNEDESEEINEPRRNKSAKRQRPNLSMTQNEAGREKTVKNQKLISPLQNRKAQLVRGTPSHEGKTNEIGDVGNAKSIFSKQAGENTEQDQGEKILELAVAPAITYERERRNVGRNAARQRMNTLSTAAHNQSHSSVQQTTAGRHSTSVKEPHEKDSEKNINSQKAAVSKSTNFTTKSAAKAITTIAKTNEKQVSKNTMNERGLSENQRYYAYLDYLYKVSFTFAVANRPPANQVTYKYFIGKGNNGLMVRTLLKTRWWWMPTDGFEGTEVNLVWTQLRNNGLIDSLKSKRKALDHNGFIYNNGGNTGENSTTTNDAYSHESANEQTDSENESTGLKASNEKAKSKLVKSKKAQGKDKITDSMDTLNKIYTKTEYNDLQNFMKSNKKKILYGEDTEELVKSSKKGHNLTVLDPTKVKIYNRMECNYHLSNKKALFYNMRAYYEAIKENPYDYLPLTFHIKSGTEDKEYAKFLEYYNSRDKEVQEIEKQISEADSNEKKALQSKRIKNIWIIKPGENTNRGHGIRVASEISEIEQILNSGEKHVNGSHKTYIVQQYMDRPLLYNKRKFDIRCYMLITSINGYMKGYWYPDGYIRTCSKEFNLKNLANKMVHLTNDAVQKKGEEYGKFENGNKVSYADFQKYLDQNMPESKINFQTDIYPRMKNMARDSIRAVYGKIDPHRREHTFEVFGLDFMIDQNFKPWIIEVNTNPCLELSAPLLARIIPTMVENALRLAVDPLFPPPMPPSSKKHLLPDNMMENNKFELIFDEVEDGPWLRSLSSSTNEVAMGQISEEEEEEDSENEETNDGAEQ